MHDFPNKLEIGYRFETKSRYDNPNNREKVFKEYIYDNRDKFNSLKRSIEVNEEAEYDYKDDFNEMMLLPPIDMYVQKESKLISNKKKEIKFDTNFKFVHQTWYTSPKGRNTYTNTREVDVDDVDFILRNIKNNKKERSEYEVFRDAERAKMTAGLRYDILSRDGHRCKICGANANIHGVTLHVDHIVPVAKGGRTIKSNLQTLCRDCNLGKGIKKDNLL